ncbi:MAG: orotidine-5'-phosphate decarboxylase [Acidobacteria bacterium]|nr:orotidine-5'-phosphate decarboxylase [Acidobacteriota bacterium]
MDQLIVALDVDSAAKARRLADTLRGAVGAFKIGSRLFTAEGPAFVRELAERGDRVFLDLKFHDIPHTVAGAVEAATRMGVWMVNVHAAGGGSMMRAARDAADSASAQAGRARPIVIAVTVLTSLSAGELRETGVPREPLEHVTHLARLAKEAGLDGVVASPQETAAIRAACGPRFAIVTPGIRGPNDAKGDQTRTLSPRDAIAAGASYIVVGRPVIGAPDPRRAAEEIVTSL